MNNSGRIKNEELYKLLSSSTNCSWDSYYGNGIANGNSYYDDDFLTGKTKRRHEFSPVVLIFSTVWNCKHCGAKKEDCRTEYCDELDDFDIGDWG